MLSASLDGCCGSCARGSIHWGGLVETGKAEEGGWGLTGVSVGIWGWATVEHPPRYCLLCQAESVFLSEAGANLSTLAKTLLLPTPDTPTHLYCRCLPLHTQREGDNTKITMIIFTDMIFSYYCNMETKMAFKNKSLRLFFFLKGTPPLWAYCLI